MTIDEVLRAKLNQHQDAAATDPAREVLCLACAGSGKSTTLAYRIARLLAEGEQPEGIVAFTFTTKAAESIKRRVSDAIVAAGLDPMVMGAMYIGTIHSFCQRILGDMDARYRQYDVLDENRLKLYLISRYARLQLGQFRTRAAGQSYFETIRQVSDAWKTANDELLDFGVVASEDGPVGSLLLRIRDSLRLDQYIDFSLMIRDAVEAIQTNSSGISKAIGRLQHLMVDEYQDVNPCQEELIRLLHQRSSTLFVVGDDDQSIYAWRGADVSNILDFENRYRECSVHTLSANYRSTTAIVEATGSFVAAMLGPSRITKQPFAVRDLWPQDLGINWFVDRENEAAWVASRIHALLGTAYDDNGIVRGLTPADFAILMRSTRTSEQDDTPRHAAFSAALSQLQIPFSLEAGGSPFDRPQTAVLRSTFGLLRNSPPDRDAVRQHYESQVLPAFPNANFYNLARVLTEWGRHIHRPEGTTRIRLYPQQLVYDLLTAFGVARTDFPDEVMRDIGLFSRMMLDVETVYMSVDSRQRFSEVLNFLENAAEAGYDVSTDDVLQRPDAVTVSTVHKMKGLEFPCVFVVDVEAHRFPKRRSSYQGWLPAGVMSGAIARGAYHSTESEEVRLFYTATTRAERYLYVTGAERLPNAKRLAKPSTYALQLAAHQAARHDEFGLPLGLEQAAPQRRLEDSDYPTSFTEIKYYLQCPKSYQFRERYGLNPSVPEMFGYGLTVHTSIQKLHEAFPEESPRESEIEQVVIDTFHLKHVPQSNDPANRPGAYERSRNRAVDIAKAYVGSYGEDFRRERQLEVAFEIPATDCVISGSIDLLLHEDEDGNILQAEIVDFKTMEGGDAPIRNDSLDWTELSLQVQLYARAAEQVLGRNARTGSVHLLKDNKRVEVPITCQAVDAALANVEWAVQGILSGDFPRRSHPEKCSECDFCTICSQTPQEFRVQKAGPPALHLPDRIEMVRAFSQYDGPSDAG
ncbi:MAG: ATP-dependent helicase [Anaerolineae bacterium]